MTPNQVKELFRHIFGFIKALEVIFLSNSKKD